MNAFVSRLKPLLFLLLAMSGTASAYVRLPAYFGDNMVLQRDRPLVFTGWGDPGERIDISDGRQPQSTIVDRDGRWRVELPARSANSGLDITIRGAHNVVELHNVAIGELWFAAGQSNMAWPMAWIAGRAGDIPTTRQPDVRIMAVYQHPSRHPEDDAEGDWYVASPETVRFYSAVAYHFARILQAQLGVPVGIMQASVGGTRIEPWLPTPTARPLYLLNPDLDNWHSRAEGPGALYNGMVAPFGSLPIRGIILYQGASNVGDGGLYLYKLSALIKQWRALWSAPDLPFFYAQVAPLDYGPLIPHLKPESLQQLWQAQIDVLATPGTGFVPTIDLNPKAQLHPDQKREVGERFAMLALHRVYGHAVVDEGPRYLSHEISGSSVRIRWTGNIDGLQPLRGSELLGFEVAGSDGVFRPAVARLEGDVAVVTSASVPRPRAVRYAWSNKPDGNLVNSAGWPALPFKAPR
jgi:sialate O-acetylesterase